MTNAPAVGAGNGRVRRRLASVCALLLSAVAFASALAVSGSPTSAAPNSLSLRATYRATAYVEWSKGVLLVTSTASVSNVTSRAVNQLTFNLVPLETGRATVTSVLVRGTRATSSASGQTLVVTLPRALRPGKRTRVTIRYRAHFNAITGTRRPLLIQKHGIVTAYRWIPWLSREQQFDSPNFGETWVTAVSRHVTVNLRSDIAVKFATTGRMISSSRHGRSQTFEASNVRDFNFAASPDYTQSNVTWNGVHVRLFTVTEPVDVLEKWTIAALERYSAKLGRYPYRQLDIAEVPAGSGMESPQMTWISSTVAESDLPYLAAHETGHQWFYGTIGNNQAFQPFLDESVADFLARDLLGAFVKSTCARNRLDGSVYDYGPHCYFDDIYLQGSNYLNRYREIVGNHDFWTGLRQFYRRHRFRIAGTRGLLDALDAASGFNSLRHARRFPSLYP